MTENWRAVVGFEGLYEVSDAGRVRSLDREYSYMATSTRGRQYVVNRRVKGRVLKPGTVESGHQLVVLGRGNSRLVHALVLTAFVGPRPAGADSCHSDGNPANNHLDNLRWGSRSDNVRDMMDHGKTRSGLCTADVVRIKAMLATHTNRQIGEAFGITGNHVGLIRNGHTWKHVA